MSHGTTTPLVVIPGRRTSSLSWNSLQPNPKPSTVRPSNSSGAPFPASMSTSFSPFSRPPLVHSETSQSTQRPPLKSASSTASVTARSVSSLRSLPPPSDPPMYPTPPTPNHNPAKTPPKSPSGKTAHLPPSNLEKSQISQVITMNAGDNQDGIVPTTSVGALGIKSTETVIQSSDNVSPRPLTGSQTPLPISSELVPLRMDRSTKAKCSRSSDPQRGSTLGPPSLHLSLDPTSSGSSNACDNTLNLSSSSPYSPPTSSCRTPGDRRGSMTSVSSTSTYRIPLKPTPTEYGDELAISRSSSSEYSMERNKNLEIRRGSTGSLAPKQRAIQDALPALRHLQSLAEAHTPTLADTLINFAASTPAPTSALPSTVMVDGQAFVLGDMSLPQARASTRERKISSLQSPLTQRSVTGDHSRGMIATQAAVASSLARSASVGNDRSRPTTSASDTAFDIRKDLSTRRSKGLGDGSGFARRPTTVDGPAALPSMIVNKSTASTTHAVPVAANVDNADSVAQREKELTVAQEEAAAGSYAIDPPSKQALMEAATLTLYSEDGELITFGEIFETRRTLICFLRHWFCPMCQEYAMSMRHLDPLPLQRANLGMVIVGQGHPHVISSYKKVMGVPEWIPMYADPTRKIYHALGMTKRTNDPGPACAKPDYITMGMMKGSMQAVKKGLFQMPIRLPGDTKLLGGEFILGPGLQSSFTHRMVTTRGHLDVPRILAQAGCDLALKTPSAIGDKGSRSVSTRSMGHLTMRRKTSHHVRPLANHYKKHDGTRSVSSPIGRRTDASNLLSKRTAQKIPAVPKLPLSALFATGVIESPASRPHTAGSLPVGHRRQQSLYVDDVPAKGSLDTGTRLTETKVRPRLIVDLTYNNPLLLGSQPNDSDRAKGDLRDYQRRTFAAGPSNSLSTSGVDRLRGASIEQLRHNLETEKRIPSRPLSRLQLRNFDSALPTSTGRTPSISNDSITNRRAEVSVTETPFDTPISSLALHSSSPLLQELRRSLSPHEPATTTPGSANQAKLVRPVTQSRRPEVITPIQVLEASAVITGSGRIAPTCLTTSPGGMDTGSASKAALDGSTSVLIMNESSHKSSLRQLRLKGSSPSIRSRSLSSPPATPKSILSSLGKEVRPPSASLTEIFRKTKLVTELREEKHVGGETAQVDPWSDEDDSGDDSIADQLAEHEQALHHQASLGSLTSTRLSSPRKPGSHRDIALLGSPGMAKTASPRSAPSVLGLAPAASVVVRNGGGASFLGELGMIDGFVRRRIDGDDEVNEDDMDRYSFESSTVDETPEPADSDSDMEHESGWIRPRSSISSRSHRSTLSRINSRGKGSGDQFNAEADVRASEDDEAFPSLEDSLRVPRPYGPSPPPSSRSTFYGGNKDSEEGEGSCEDVDVDELDDGFAAAGSGAGNRRGTPLGSGHLGSLEEDEEEEGDVTVSDAVDNGDGHAVEGKAPGN